MEKHDLCYTACSASLHRLSIFSLSHFLIMKAHSVHLGFSLSGLMGP